MHQALKAKAPVTTAFLTEVTVGVALASSLNMTARTFKVPDGIAPTTLVGVKKAFEAQGYTARLQSGLPNKVKYLTLEWL